MLITRNKEERRDALVYKNPRLAPRGWQKCGRKVQKLFSLSHEVFEFYQKASYDQKATVIVICKTDASFPQILSSTSPYFLRVIERPGNAASEIF